MSLTPQAAFRKDKTTQPSLEHRHFAFIAQTISAIDDKPTRRRMAQHFADACRHTNPRFDEGRFLRACVG